MLSWRTSYKAGKVCYNYNSFSIKQTDALISKFIFWYTTLHVSGSFRAHHQELITVQSALAHFMQV